MTADVLCDEGVVKQSARVQLRRRSVFPAAGDGGGKTISHVGKLKTAGIQLGRRGRAKGPGRPGAAGAFSCKSS